MKSHRKAYRVVVWYTLDEGTCRMNCHAVHEVVAIDDYAACGLAEQLTISDEAKQGRKAIIDWSHTPSDED